MNSYSSITELLAALKNDTAIFNDVITFVDTSYDFIPISFVNGNKTNELGENNGSAKVFALAKSHGLSKAETLALFAEHYKKVVATPTDTDHDNIRNFIEFGWEGIKMSTNPLTNK